MSEDTLDQLKTLLESEGEADDVLRAVVARLSEAPGVTWAGIAFLEEGELVLGPAAGAPDEARRARTPISYGDDPVGELWVDGSPERELPERVVKLISPYVLVGWDTGGEAWQP